MIFFRETKNLILLMVMVLFITFQSCEKDDDVPDYIGTWTAIDEIDVYDGFTQYKNILTITENEFVDFGQIYNSSTENWLDYQKTRAEIIVTGDVVNSTIVEIGVTSFNSSGLPTGDITTYTEDDNFFETLLEQMGQSQTISSEFHVQGDQLTIKTDRNEDGDFLDEGEIRYFTKE